MLHSRTQLNMSRIILLLVICLIIATVVQSDRVIKYYEPLRQFEPYKALARDAGEEVTEEYITQRLDNFDPQNNRTFQMVNEKSRFFVALVSLFDLSLSLFLSSLVSATIKMKNLPKKMDRF